MPRTARVAFPSLVYHIISRGNNREWVFNEGEDLKNTLGYVGDTGRNLGLSSTTGF